MRISAPCIRCLVERQEERIRKFEDMDAKAGYLKEVLRIIGGSREQDSAPVLVAEIQKKYEEYFGRDERYKQLKRLFNHRMLLLEKDIRSEIEKSREPLRYALTFARIGNYIDFGAMKEVDTEVLKELIGSAEADMVEEKVFAQLTQELKQAKRLVYLLDNCGEIVLDKLVMEQLHREYPRLRITAVVRGSEVLNDVTMADAVETGLAGAADILENGTDIAGTELSRINQKTRQALETADLIISKGQGNFETLNGCGLNIYYLFLCKCDWFVSRFGLARNAGVFLREREPVLHLRENVL